jgi:putative transposase
MVNNLKAVSSRRLRLQNTYLTRQSKSAALWSRSYFAGTAGSAAIETLKAHVERQATPD